MSKSMEHIEEIAFSNVIGDRFGRYSKYIIQDRALPDIRDGLKPVQRRILYAMYRDRNTDQHPYRKSAKTVGNVIGNYHPHGDTSVYDAMVRMSQDWKNRAPLIDMHGNNGSMDGDPAAAMRYTEARLMPIASELLSDIDYDTVEHGLNFDDTLEEPLVLPASYPNLLVNGATGISAGYATDIPPHNLSEVIDAAIYMLKHKDYTLDDILHFVHGPDFPTGGIIQGAQAFKEVYQTGRGKIVVRSKTEIEKLKAGKSQIVATELPYEVNKTKLIQRLDDIRLQHKVEGIVEVRDESDRNGVRLVIELKRDADAEGILTYLFKNTDLQMNYNFNMVAIHHHRPVQASLTLLLESYIQHRQEVIKRRTSYLKDADEARLHIVDGLIRVLSIIDEVIQTIRSSENKQDAKKNLVSQYDFSMAQAEAIVNLQLYRLTNTDIVSLQDERLNLNENIMRYNQILTNAKTLDQVIIQELTAIQKKYGTPRLTQVQEEIETLNVDTTLLVAKENVVVSVTKEGYFKRTSLRSFVSSDTVELGQRELDHTIFVKEMTTYDAIVMITNLGNYIFLPIYEMPDIKWKDLGHHVSQVYQLKSGERIIAVFKALEGIEGEINQSHLEANVVLTTKLGMIKQTPLKEFATFRSYKTRTLEAMKLDAGDEVIQAQVVTDDSYEVMLLTHRSYALRYSLSEVSTYGLKAKGVKAINLKDGDEVIASLIIHSSLNRPQYIALTQRGHVKRSDIASIPMAKRGGRGVLTLKELKSNPHRLQAAIFIESQSIPVIIQGDTGQQIELETRDVPLSDRLSNGSMVPTIDTIGQLIDFYPARLKIIDESTQNS